MGEKNSDGGQFFTPREVIRGMVHTLNPQAGETVYDPCCGTGGFLAVAFEHISRNPGDAPAATMLDVLKHDTFFGREKENLKALKKDKADKEKISGIEEAIKAKEKAIREAQTNAADIDSAVYDLRAVNPNWSKRK